MLSRAPTPTSQCSKSSSRQYEIPTDTVQVITLDPNDVGAAIRDDKVDVLLVAGTLAGKTIADVVAVASNERAAPTFLALDQLETIEKKFSRL
jgi:hypothetical protein